MRQKRLLIVVGILCLGLMVSVLPFGKADAASPVIRLKVAQYFAPASMQAIVLEEFCRELEKRTGGQVKVDYYASQSLLSSTVMFDGILKGYYAGDKGGEVSETTSP